MHSEFKTILFSGTCQAGQSLVLVSHRISTPFQLVDMSFSFALNTNRLLQIKPFVSPDASAPASGEPSGFNLLFEYGQAHYVTGDDQTKFFKHSFHVYEAGSFFKIYANNIDDFDHTVDVHITIQIDSPKET